MEVLNKNTLISITGGFYLPLAIYLAYLNYENQETEKESRLLWGGGSFGGAGAGGSW